MRVLITGARGFVGSSLGCYAAAQGHTVLGIARTSQPPASWPGTFASADILHADVAPIVEKFTPDLIVHCAGSASVSESFQRPAEDFQSSAGTFSNLLDGVRRTNLKPLVILVSSAAVYGNPATLPVSEEQTSAPVSPYGFHKAAAELVARAYACCFDLRICICRLFSVYGAAQRRLLVWELFQQFTSESREVSLAGTGKESRDYLHIDDIASAVLQLHQALKGKELNGKPLVVNVASGQGTLIADLAASIRRLGLWEKAVHFRGDVRLGDPKQWRAQTSKLRELLPDWNPCSLDQGLSAVLAVWRTEP